jgi:crotonobetainyl-CoA:carnitine CoA-transferase CaiB-like acyl-CoA transferase
MVVDLEHPRHGTLPTLGTPIKVDGALEAPPAPPARLGEHTEPVLRDLLKYPAERIEALRREGVIL